MPAGAPAERHHEQAVGRADREQVEDHRLERQEQRAERAHEHEVGDGEHAEHEPGEDAVGAVDEVDAGRRPAARVHARAAEARPRDVAVPEAARELLGLIRAVVVPRRDDDARVAAGRVGRQVGRQPGLGRRLHDRDLGIAAHLRARGGGSRASPSRMPPGAAAVDDGDQRRDRARARACARAASRPCTEGACEGRLLLDPGVSERNGAGSAQRIRKPPVRPATSAGPAHDRLGDARPGAALALGAQADQRHAQAQQARAEDRQQRGQQRERGADRDERDEQAADAHGADERQRDQHEARQPDRDRRAREEHRAAGRAHRRAQRLALVRAAPAAPRGSGRRRAASSRSRSRCRSA